MKILQLLGHGGLGGTESFAISLVRGLVDRGHDAVLVNTWTESPMNQAAEQAAIPFVAIRGGRRRIGPRWFRAVYRYLADNRFDVIHTYGLRMSLGLRLMQRALRVSHHAMGVRGLDQQRTGPQAYLDRKTESRLDLIICNAQAVAEKRMRTIGTPASRIRVIPNGIDLSRFSPNGQAVSRASLGLPDGFLFISVASYRPEKDHATLLNAVKTAGESLSGASLLLIGAGESTDHIGREIARSGLSDRVITAGVVADVRPYLRASDAFVLSSYSEGMPRALMEAMAVGMPAVVTDAGGVGEVVTHERNGLLVPTRNPAALADAMTRVMQDARLRSDLGRAAAETIRDHFDQDGMIDRYVETYRAILAGECDR